MYLAGVVRGCGTRVAGMEKKREGRISAKVRYLLTCFAEAGLVAHSPNPETAFLSFCWFL